MAYLHCHKCGWSQDDFWNWTIKWKSIFNWHSRPFGYNPLSIMLEDIATYYKPRFISMDSYWAKENGFKSNRVHSWWFIKEGFIRCYRVVIDMKYNSHAKFKMAYDSNQASCPKCGSKDDFDID